MKISEIRNNARKKSFEIKVGKKEYSFPYVKLRVVPRSEDPVAEVFPDPELGEEAFTYRLESGEEDTVHLDAVLEVNKDPDYLQDLLLHRLTIEARNGVEESGLGKRQVARQLGTSPSQLYRLLDPGNRAKSLGQMLALLHLVDREVDLVVHRKSSPTRLRTGVFQVYEDKGGLYRFRIRDAEGGIVLSSHAYKTKTGCLKAIGNVHRYAARDELFERKKTEGGRYQFLLKARNHQVIAKSPSYATAARRDAALATVRRRVGDVVIEEAGV